MLLKGNYAGATYYFFYGHLGEFIKKKGDQVNAGEVIAKTGKTGDAYSMKTWQEHLHFEVRTTGNDLGRGLAGRVSPAIITELNRDEVLNPKKENQPK